MISFSRLPESANVDNNGRRSTYRISKRVALVLPVTPPKKLGILRGLSSTLAGFLDLGLGQAIVDLNGVKRWRDNVYMANQGKLRVRTQREMAGEMLREQGDKEEAQEQVQDFLCAFLSCTDRSLPPSPSRCLELSKSTFILVIERSFGYLPSRQRYVASVAMMEWGS